MSLGQDLTPQNLVLIEESKHLAPDALSGRLLAWMSMTSIPAVSLKWFSTLLTECLKARDKAHAARVAELHAAIEVQINLRRDLARDLILARAAVDRLVYNGLKR